VGGDARPASSVSAAFGSGLALPTTIAIAACAFATALSVSLISFLRASSVVNGLSSGIDSSLAISWLFP
jgi:hypothetical protein